jgi:hypothetical protein
MKRIVIATILALTLATQPVSAMVIPGHWTYGHSYIVTNNSMGLWQVVTYYWVRLNGYRVELTQPMQCEVPYAIGLSIDITYCGLDIIYKYVNYRWTKLWRVTDHWRQCFISSFFGICSTHGHSLAMDAFGITRERLTW